MTCEPSGNVASTARIRKGAKKTCCASVQVQTLAKYSSFAGQTEEINKPAGSILDENC